MPITRQAIIENTGTSGEAVAGSVVTDISSLSLQPGDILIVWAGFGNGSTDRNFDISGNNSGAFQEINDLYANKSNDVNAAAAYQIVGGTADTTITVTVNDGINPIANAQLAIQILHYRGVNPTTPMDVAAIGVSGVDTAVSDPGAITPVTTGAKIIALYACSNQTPGDWTAPGNISNFDQIANASRALIGSGDADWSGGTFNPDAATKAVDNRDTWAAITLALRPALAAARSYGFIF